MTIKEFTERTGFYPTYEHYKFIEKSYMGFDGDKDAFCKAYRTNENGLAAKIARETERYIEEQTELGMHEHDAMKKRLNAQQEEIEKLKAQLDAELEWQPSRKAGTLMSQDAYEDLRDDPDTKVLTVEETASLIAEEYGFDPAHVKIIDTVETYEVNRHGKLRVSDCFEREPLYSCADWNYIRFDVKGIGYEYINSGLHYYEA